MTETDFESLWKNLVQRMHGADEPALSKHERHFYAVNLLRGSVPRSGFIGYFENWSGSEIADAYEGLRALELPSALELLEQEFDVWVVTDACTSRHERDRDAAFDRLAGAGAELLTTEMVMFEWLRDCEHPAFKNILSLIK